MKQLLNFAHTPRPIVVCIIFLIPVILYVPAILKIILIVLVVGMCLLEGMKLKLWMGFRERTGMERHPAEPMVSVHLAVCNEPVDMVIETIGGILAQDYGNFELIVVDNNTSDENLWKPVRDFCKPLDKVRFFHLEHWPFYKSGALNFARKLTHTNAEFIFVVDADYVLTTDALHLAVSHLESESIALVQFPQAYRCQNVRHVPLLEEFDHFFDYYCFKADSCYGALATGTLSLIRISALDGVGGWPVNSITEDAELGARLQAEGHDIKYVHRIIGKGIAPIYQEDFLKQRKRWIFGNVQTLTNYSTDPLCHFNKWVSGVSQLTAWVNMLGLPILCLLMSLVLYPWSDSETFGQLAGLCYLTYWIFILSKMLQLQLVHRPPSYDAVRIFLIHFNSMDIGAFHWWPVLTGSRRPFVKTDKAGTKSGYRFNLLYPILHVGIFLCALQYGFPFIAFSALFISLLHSLAMNMDYRCRTDGNSSIMFNLKLQL